MKNKEKTIAKLDQKVFRAILPALVSIIVLSIPLLSFPQKNLWIRIIGYAGLYIILGLGLLVHVGLAGMFDLGFAAFYAIGAYTYAFLASPHFNIHLPFLLVILIAGALAAIVGALVCIPVLKLRGDYLGIVTLGFGEIVRMLLMNLTDITNGSQGIIQIDKPVIFGINFSNSTYFYYFIFLLIATLLFLLNRVINSRTGRAWLAMREDEDVAQMSGINTSKYKMLARRAGRRDFLFMARFHFPRQFQRNRIDQHFMCDHSGRAGKPPGCYSWRNGADCIARHSAWFFRLPYDHLRFVIDHHDDLASTGFSSPQGSTN